MIVFLTFCASALAATFFALRCDKLKPERVATYTAPVTVRSGVFLMAAVFSFHALAVAMTQRATFTELVLAAGGAAYAYLLWRNLRSMPTPLAARRRSP